jgi:PPM family protein phosphatase
MIDVEAAGLSDRGPRRAVNEDTLGSFEPSDALQRERKGRVYVLADGVGGHQAGEVASATAVSTVLEEYYSPSSHARIEPALQQAIQTANLRVHELGLRRPECRAMETTLTVLVLAGCHAYIGHVGDTRVYLWRGGRLAQLTSDHTEAAELVRMRIVSPDRLRDHPNRNVLTRSIGGHMLVRPDFARERLEAGDTLLMCTDGLWGEVYEDEIGAVLAKYPPAEACERLVTSAIARDCNDNVTVQVVRIRAVDEAPEESEVRGGVLANMRRRLRRA